MRAASILSNNLPASSIRQMSRYADGVTIRATFQVEGNRSASTLTGNGQIVMLETITKNALGPNPDPKLYSSPRAFE